MLIKELLEYRKKDGIAEKFWYNPGTNELFNMNKEDHPHHVKAVDEPSKNFPPKTRSQLLAVASNQDFYSGPVNLVMMQYGWVRVDYSSHKKASIEAGSMKEAAATLRMMAKKTPELLDKKAYVDIRTGDGDGDRDGRVIHNPEIFIRNPNSPKAFEEVPYYESEGSLNEDH